MGQDSHDDARTMRRPIPQRTSGWARTSADLLARMGLTPNRISVLSVLIAVLGCLAFIMAGNTTDVALRVVWLLVAGACAPLRLLCNMLDGMLAVEHGLQSPVGDLYNEVPDRLSDLLFLVGAGYALGDIVGGDVLGWTAGTLAVLTAYVRSLGAAQGLSNHFDGPMAKPRRMWVLLAGTILAIVELFVPLPSACPWSIALAAALVIIALGSLITIVIRLRVISRELHGKAS